MLDTDVDSDTDEATDGDSDSFGDMDTDTDTDTDMDTDSGYTFPDLSCPDQLYMPPSDDTDPSDDSVVCGSESHALGTRCVLAGQLCVWPDGFAPTPFVVGDPRELQASRITSPDCGMQVVFGADEGRVLLSLRHDMEGNAPTGFGVDVCGERTVGQLRIGDHDQPSRPECPSGEWRGPAYVANDVLEMVRLWEQEWMSCTAPDVPDHCDDCSCNFNEWWSELDGVCQE